MFRRFAKNIQIAFGKKDTVEQPPPMIKVWVSIVITFLVLGVGLYIILSPGYDNGVKKWAFGAVGAIIGYWLKD